MKINWMGHACFFIETEKKKILCDPFSDGTGYPLFKGNADLVTISHDHWDHNAFHLVGGNPLVVRDPGSFSFEDIQIKGIPSFHDKAHGKKRGSNIIYKISVDGINLVHLGDLGHVLTREQVKEIGEHDILFLPVGGTFTVNAEEAYEITVQLKPKIVIPMHFKTPVNSFDIDPAEAYTIKFERIVKKPFLKIDRTELAYPTQVIVLDYPVN
ncbi:MAG TPA: MBL fold metallo-hydrolase [Syntrophomonadaceae bacterium]|nr:MBL fold metallo-hydrolase [Syntrophomonadaceae bacterium]HRX22175.1 MBL fold metallo-hydrolase [Syntrophomonadaceae bacterium]